MKDHHVNSNWMNEKILLHIQEQFAHQRTLAIKAVEAALCLKASLEGGIGFVINFFLEGVWSICWMLISELDILTLFN